MQLHPRIAKQRPQSSNRHAPRSTLLQRLAVYAWLGRVLQVIKELLCEQAAFLTTAAHLKLRISLCFMFQAADLPAAYLTSRLVVKMLQVMQARSQGLTSSVGSVPLYWESAACRERRVAARWSASSCSSGAKMRPAYLRKPERLFHDACPCMPARGESSGLLIVREDHFNSVQGSTQSMQAAGCDEEVHLRACDRQVKCHRWTRRDIP